MSDLDPRLGNRIDELADELAELRQLDLPSRFLDIEDRLDQRVNMLRQLGDEWSSLVTPVSRAGGLRGLNGAVDTLARRVQRLTVAVAVLTAVTVVLAILVIT